MDIDKVDLILKFILKIGCFTTAVSLLGLFVPNVKNDSNTSVALNALYTSAIVSGALFAAVIIAALVAQRADFTSDQLSSMAKRNWRLMYAFKRDQMDQFQRENGCCGWHNVFDYCSPHAMFAIQYESIKHKQLGDLLSSIDDSSTDDSSSSSSWYGNASDAFFSRLITGDNIDDLLGTGFLILATYACNIFTYSHIFTYNDVFYNFMDCYIDKDNKAVKGSVSSNTF